MSYSETAYTLLETNELVVCSIENSNFYYITDNVRKYVNTGSGNIEMSRHSFNNPNVVTQFETVSVTSIYDLHLTNTYDCLEYAIA